MISSELKCGVSRSILAMTRPPRMTTTWSLMARISERVSAVREADCILVLENGRIDAQGCHDALMASCRRYQRMAKLQMGGDVG